MKPSRCLLAGLASLLLAPAASACITVGVYQDNPPASFHSLRHATGPGLTAISTYLTAGQPLQQSLIDTANRNHASLLVTWDPDAGHDGATQSKYRLSAIVRGRYDRSLRALVAQLAEVHDGAVLRPMPEMNTPWYAWSGTVNGNTPAEYVAAWKRVRKAVESAPGGHKLRLLWAPYAQSIPDTPANGLRAYFPGASEVDLVGASAYNFGATAPLQWTDPGTLFYSAYQAIEALVAKPFWLAETGSTGVGGDQAGWIDTLATLQQSAMPKLAGIVWYDIDDPTGDFRLRGNLTIQAFRSLLKEGCR
jgi:mannan endo-1,4-beta-mannosidase